jgi:hypothetical protein
MRLSLKNFFLFCRLRKTNMLSPCIRITAGSRSVIITL